VLFDRFALVVEDRATRSDPAMRSIRQHKIAVDAGEQCARTDVAAGLWDVSLALRRVAGLGLNLLLNFAPETVGVREADLNFRLRAARVVVMSFARERRRERRLTAAAPTVEVINDARRGLAQQGSGLTVRIGDEALQRSRRQVGVKIFEQVAEILNLFPPHCRSH